MSRIIVLGAGIGGLSAAIALAGEGHEVTVIDPIRRRPSFPPMPPLTNGSAGASASCATAMPFSPGSISSSVKTTPPC